MEETYTVIVTHDRTRMKNATFILCCFREVLLVVLEAAVCCAVGLYYIKQRGVSATHWQKYFFFCQKSSVCSVCKWETSEGSHPFFCTRDVVVPALRGQDLGEQSAAGLSYKTRKRVALPVPWSGSQWVSSIGFRQLPEMRSAVNWRFSRFVLRHKIHH